MANKRSLSLSLKAAGNLAGAAILSLSITET